MPRSYVSVVEGHGVDADQHIIGLERRGSFGN